MNESSRAAFCMVGVLMMDEEFKSAVLDGDVRTELDIVRVNDSEYVFGVLINMSYLSERGAINVLDIDEFRTARKEVENEVLHLSLDNLQDLAIYNFIGEEDDHLF